MRKLLTLAIICSHLSFAAINASTVWEVRLGVGAATNGGGYSSGGTDMSVFNAKNAAGCTVGTCQSNSANLSTTDAVTNNTTTVTSATAAFSAALVGNTIYLTGTGTTTGWYQVASVTNATTIVVDRATGSTGGTGVTMNIGGALDLIGTACTALADGNTVWVTGSLNRTATDTCGTTAGTVGGGVLIQGYGSARGDAGVFTYTATSAFGNRLLNVNEAYYTVTNAKLNCGSQSNVSGLEVNTGSNVIIRNSEVTACGAIGIQLNGVADARIYGNYIHGGPTGCAEGILVASTATAIVEYNTILSNLCPGVVVGTGQTNILRNVIAANTVGIDTTSTSAHFLDIENNDIDANSSDGIKLEAQSPAATAHIRNNLITNNGGWGINNVGTALVNRQPADYNFFFGNTSGLRNGVPAGANDITGSGTPYTNTAGGDYTLNNTAGAGAAARGAAYLTPMNGLTSSVSHQDIGALQSAGSGGAAGTVGFAYVQ